MQHTVTTVQELQQLIGAATAAGTVVLLDFLATWCKPCKAIQPTLESLQKQFGAKLTIVAVDVDRAEPALTNHFQVKSLPSLVWIKNNQVVAVHTGADANAITVKCAEVL